MWSDEESVEVELSAVAEFLKNIEDECIAKPQTYEDRKARREAEIAGLEEDLTLLEFFADVRRASIYARENFSNSSISSFMRPPRAGMQTTRSASTS